MKIIPQILYICDLKKISPTFTPAKAARCCSDRVQIGRRHESNGQHKRSVVSYPAPARPNKKRGCVSPVLHPRKVYLQSCCKGVPFVGAYIAPFRTYLSKRTVSNFKSARREISQRLSDTSRSLTEEDCRTILARVNSYLGLSRHFRSVRMCSAGNAACRVLPLVFGRGGYYEGGGLSPRLNN